MSDKAPLVIVLMGVSGCGKSTVGAELSRRLGWPFRDADSFHPPANIAKMSRGTPLTDADRAPWLDAIAQWIDDRLARGAPGIVSCSALKRAYRQRIVGARDRVALVYLKGDIGLIAARLTKRTSHFMPAALLASQFDALEEPQRDERPVIVSIEETPAGLAAAIIAELGCTAAEGA
ncbi:MAG TPA: gluconokinase [Hyphomicrobiaceae bacterium]|jgi:carbohydrate kinase (thermoresistant glucokinase family)|nr:gluconokinase [Hyphomicrobiaceae bacterium]